MPCPKRLLLWIFLLSGNCADASDAGGMTANTQSTALKYRASEADLRHMRSLGKLTNAAYKKAAAGRFSEAYQLCDQALKTKPNDVDAILLKARIDGGLERAEAAVTNFDQACALNCNSFEEYDYVGAARMHLFLGHAEKALQYYDHGLKKYPSDAQMYADRATLECHLRQFDKASKDLDMRIKIRPDAKGYLARGNFLMQRGRHKDAIADYTQAIHLDPAWSVALGCRAHAYEKIGETKLAELDKERARQIGGTFEDPNFYRPAK